jgi:hypothetical protein
MASDQALVTAVQCLDCGTPLNTMIEGFRPATVDEMSRLTPQAVRLLGLCGISLCPGKPVPAQRGKR